MPSFPIKDLNGLMPHGMCFLWDSTLLGLHVISDSLIALSYFSIPLALLYFSKKGGTLPFKYLFGLFSAFIFACGLTHILSIWTICKPDYYAEGLVKSITAVISLLTAILLWPVVCKILSLLNLLVLQDANRHLEEEIQRRRAIEEELRAQASRMAEANEELLRFNRHLSGREIRMLHLKQEVNTLAQSLGRPSPYDINPGTT